MNFRFLVMMGLLMMGSLEAARWERVDYPLQGPSSRYAHRMASDLESGVITLFGFNFTGDLMPWRYADAAWTHEHSLEPFPRSYFGFVRARAMGGHLLFGGEATDMVGSRVAMNELWIKKGLRWQRLWPNSMMEGDRGPSERSDFSMAWDSHRNVLVVFGGRDKLNRVVGDLWEWKAGSGWKEIALRRGPWPVARRGSELVFDPVRKHVVLFGGARHDGQAFGDTWQWDGKNWQALSANQQPSPEARFHHMMTYSTAMNALLLFGGRATVGSFMNDLWALTTEGWTRLNIPGFTPESRALAAMAEDPRDQHIYLYGGVDDLTGDRGDVWRFVASD